MWANIFISSKTAHLRITCAVQLYAAVIIIIEVMPNIPTNYSKMDMGRVLDLAESRLQILFIPVSLC